MIHFKWYNFNELSLEQLYTILKLRSEVFVVDQGSIYLDPDGQDFYTLHLLGLEKHEIVAYLRLFPPGDLQYYVKFGRVLTAKSVRTKGYGKKLMEELLQYCHKHYSGVIIKCQAQHYLQKFYEGFGFKTISDVYDETGVPHIDMQKD